MTFEELIATAKAGEEISSESQSGADNDKWLAVWYDAGETGDIMVCYDHATGKPISAQIVGTTRVFYAPQETP